MTAKESAALVGKKAVMTHGTIKINVRILDLKEHFGRVDYLVTPLSGSGQQWSKNIEILAPARKTK